MNTDNMSILGLTLDYGPFGFLDAYDAGFICNHTDQGGRYAFDRQPSIGLWNCNALAAALVSLVNKDDAAAALDSYQTAFRETYLPLLAAKFGLSEVRGGDPALFADCYTALQNGRVDHTNFFPRALLARTREHAVRRPRRGVFLEPFRMVRLAARLPRASRERADSR